MKPNPKSRKIRFSLFILSLYCIFGLSHGQSSNQYSSYSAYSTLPNPQSSPSVSGSGIPGNPLKSSSEEAYKNVDMTSNSVGVESGGDQSQRSVGTSGYTPQAQGSHNMYYYEMYPSAKQAGQRCTYTASGMKCQYRRESAAESHQDSYSQAAAGSPSNSYGVPMQAYGMTEYGEETEMEGGLGGGLGGGGSIGGLAALAGLKGGKIKGIVLGLKALTTLLPLLPLLLPVLLPILLLALPILLLALAVPLLLLLFIPIPIIVTPIGRVARGKENGEDLFKTVAIYSIARMARDVLQSEECVERISCEVARVSKKYQAEGWMNKLAGYLPESNPFANKIRIGMKNEEKKSGESNTADESGSGRGINNSESDGKCSRFVCKPTKIISKHLVQ